MKSVLTATWTLLFLTTQISCGEAPATQPATSRPAATQPSSAAKSTTRPAPPDTKHVRHGIKELQLVPEVDIERYMGGWYEVARYPNFYQRGLVGVVAEYAMREDGKISVTNTGRDETLDGEIEQSEAHAVIQEGSRNARWNVYFLPLIPAPYCIIDLCEDYRYAVVGQPSRKNLWILSRSPQLSKADWRGIKHRLRMQGYDPNRLQMTPHQQPERP